MCVYIYIYIIHLWFLNNAEHTRPDRRDRQAGIWNLLGGAVTQTGSSLYGLGEREVATDVDSGFFCVRVPCLRVGRGLATI